MKNKQLTLPQRYQIQSLLQVNTSKKRISELLGTHISSIYREIKRNKGKRGYTALWAQEQCDIRKERYACNRKFTSAMEIHIRDKLTNEQWSPGQITGRAKVECVAMVSHERIYQFIRLDKQQGGDLWRYTRHKLKHRKRPVTGKQVNIKNKISIELRPKIVESKERCGDWEIDTIIGAPVKAA